MSKKLVVFITAGEGGISKTRELITMMSDIGVDYIEVGVPFSDPVAEGAVIEQADLRAFGTTLDDIFAMVSTLRVKCKLLLMGYFNPVFRYGVEKYKKRCREVGIVGSIIPDLPFEESDEFGEGLVSMVTPNSLERAEMIARKSKGEFIYCVSSLGVTGTRETLTNDIGNVIQKMKKVSDTPMFVGFGISNAEQAVQMAKISDGVIIGSKIVRLAHEQGIDAVKNFIVEVISCLKQF